MSNPPFENPAYGPVHAHPPTSSKLQKSLTLPRGKLNMFQQEQRIQAYAVGVQLQKCIYSRTSPNGPSENRTTSEKRTSTAERIKTTVELYSTLETSEKRTPPRSGQPTLMPVPLCTAPMNFCSSANSKTTPPRYPRALAREHMHAKTWL